MSKSRMDELNDKILQVVREFDGLAFIFVMARLPPSEDMGPGIAMASGSRMHLNEGAIDLIRRMGEEATNAADLLSSTPPKPDLLN